MDTFAGSVVNRVNRYASRTFALVESEGYVTVDSPGRQFSNCEAVPWRRAEQQGWRWHRKEHVDE